VNERIRAREVRLIDEKGAQLGVVPTREALRIARERNLDLIEVAPNAQPPVCRIMDYGKHKYQHAKRQREARKRQKGTEVRLLRMKAQIGIHDLQIKLRKVRQLLSEGNKVRVTVRFRGREMTRPQLGTDLLERVVQELSDIAQSEGRPRLEGRMMTMMLNPRPGVKPVPKKKEKPDRPAEAKVEQTPVAPEQPKEPEPEPAVQERQHEGEDEDTEDGGEAG
jgi:translation initiation factor IF-3